MSQVRLELANYGYLDLSDAIPLALNFNLNDVRDISTRGGVWSKTIKIPGTNHNNSVLGNIFDVNLEALTFNQNVREDCSAIIDGFTAFEGVFQIRKINKVYINSEDFKIEYDCYVQSDGSSFYSDISGKYLTELNLSELDHAWNRTTMLSSMTGGTWEDGYQYFLGSVDNEFADYEARDLVPAIYAKTYWDKIFQEAGYTYEFDELGDIKFDKLAIPYNGERLQPEVAAQYRFAAGISSGYEYWLMSTNSYNPPSLPPTVAGRTGFYTNNQPISGITNGRADVIFNDDTTSPWLDPNGLYEITTGKYDVIGFNGAMEFETKYEVSMQLLMTTFTASPPSNNISAQSGYAEVWVRNSVRVYDVNDVLLGTIGVYDSESIMLNDTGTTTTFSTNYKVEAAKFNIQQFSIYSSNNYPTASYVKNVVEFKTQLDAVNDPWLGFLDGASRYQANIYTVFYSQPNDVGHFNNSPETFIIEGSPITIKSVIPKKVKQSDFILSMVKMYNLYIKPDDYEPKKLIVKTRDKFYDDGVELDWTNKLDIKSVDIELISNTQKKRKIFTYTEDSSDAVSKVYIDQNNEIYGQLEYVMANEFIKDVDTVEPIFSPTFLTTQGDNGGSYRIIPSINARLPKNNIRIFYVGDIVDGTWSYYDGQGNVASGFTDYNQYRFVGHVYPNAVSPNQDLHFGICDYYSHTGGVTNNNLYNQYYRKQMSIFDTGHIMTAYFNLSYVDVANLKLSERIYVKDSWWNINKIIDFDLNNIKLTKVELISSDSDVQPFVANYNVLVNNVRDSNMNKAENKTSLDNSTTNTVGVGVRNTQIIGTNNVVQPNTNTNLIIGKDNTVFGSNNFVKGSNNKVDGDNITVFGVDGGEFTESNTLYVGSLIQVGSAAQDKTYDELVAIVAADELSAGSYYYLTDFQTIYDRPDYTGTTNPSGNITTVTGNTEPLLLLAISSDEFADVAFSPDYPDDYIRYEFEYDTTYVNLSPAKGRIIERRDRDGNRADFDFRAVTYKRYDRSGDLNYVWYWNSGSNNSTLVAAIGAGSTEVVLGNCVTMMEDLGHDFNLPNSPVGINCNNFTVREYGVNNHYGDNKLGCTFGKNHTMNRYGDSWSYTTMGDYYTDNIFGDTYTYNTFGHNYSDNTFGDGYNSNSFGNLYNSNTFSTTWVANMLGNGFNFNTFGGSYYTNSFNNDYSTNSLGNSYNFNNFASTYEDNTFGDGYYGNMFGSSYSLNIFGSNYQQNKLGSQIYDCTILDDVLVTESTSPITSIDFTSATIIYATYYKKFIETSNGNLKLWTIDDAGVSTMNAPTA